MTKTKANKVSINDFIIDGKPTQQCWDYISNLAKVVISKYFYKYTDYFDKDDLTSLAISDAVAFTIKVAENNNSGCNVIKNVRNVLFTRIRNTLSNFIFRSNKLVNTEDEILDLNIVYPTPFYTFQILTSSYYMINLAFESNQRFGFELTNIDGELSLKEPTRIWYISLGY